MQTYFSMGLIQTYTHTHVHAGTHTELVKPFSKGGFEKSRVSGGFEKSRSKKRSLEWVVVVELLRCVLPSLPRVGD